MIKSGMRASMAALGAAATLGATGLVASQPVSAADWSSTSIGWRYGTRFSEPFNTRDIKKNIFNLTHASGYTYGSNFFNVDALFSDGADPKNANSTEGAQEVYIVYRHTASPSVAT